MLGGSMSRVRGKGGPGGILRTCRDGVRSWANPSASAVPEWPAELQEARLSPLRFCCKSHRSGRVWWRDPGKGRLSAESAQATLWQIRVFNPASSGFCWGCLACMLSATPGAQLPPELGGGVGGPLCTPPHHLVSTSSDVVSGRHIMDAPPSGCFRGFQAPLGPGAKGRHTLCCKSSSGRRLCADRHVGIDTAVPTSVVQAAPQAFLLRRTANQTGPSTLSSGPHGPFFFKHQKHFALGYN